MNIDRLSLNQITTNYWNVAEAVAGSKAAGIRWISLWRDKVAEAGVHESVRLVHNAGLKVSSLCRGGMFAAATATERSQRIADNRRAIDEAAELGAEVLVLVCGPAPDKDIGRARDQVAQGIEAILPYAEAAHIPLGIEPLHPVFAGDRSVIVTLAEANNLVSRFASPVLGVVIDVYHVWWDPNVYQEIQRAAGHILGFHVNDWVLPMGIPLTARGLMGDGVIDIPRLSQAVLAAGYQGPIEVEILNQEIWARPYPALLEDIKTRFVVHV